VTTLGKPVAKIVDTSNIPAPTRIARHFFAVKTDKRKDMVLTERSSDLQPTFVLLL